jgi:hypothetical protein
MGIFLDLTRAFDVINHKLRAFSSGGTRRNLFEGTDFQKSKNKINKGSISKLRNFQS